MTAALPGVEKLGATFDPFSPQNILIVVFACVLIMIAPPLSLVWNRALQRTEKRVSFLYDSTADGERKVLQFEIYLWPPSRLEGVRFGRGTVYTPRLPMWQRGCFRWLFGAWKCRCLNPMEEMRAYWWGGEKQMMDVVVLYRWGDQSQIAETRILGSDTHITVDVTHGVMVGEDTVHFRPMSRQEGKDLGLPEALLPR